MAEKRHKGALGRGWVFHIKQRGMLVVLLKGVKFRCSDLLRVFQANGNILSHYISFRVLHEELEKNK